MPSRRKGVQNRAEEREPDHRVLVAPDGARFHVVIVDDDQSNLDELVLALNRFYDVKAFTDPQEALAYSVNGKCPDLIITDQQMPQMTGVELLCEVGKAHPHCVGFLLSSFTERTELLGAINRAPVVGYVTKPWKVEELKESVEQAIRVSQKKLATKNMTVQLNSLRAEIRGLKVVLKSLTDKGADLEDPRVQEVRSKIVSLRGHLSKLTKSPASTGAEFDDNLWSRSDYLVSLAVSDSVPDGAAPSSSGEAGDAPSG